MDGIDNAYILDRMDRTVYLFSDETILKGGEDHV
jgi:hypothetical protein